MYAINNSIQLPMLNHKFIGIINDIEDSRNPIINCFLKSEYIAPCTIKISSPRDNNLISEIHSISEI